MQKLIQNKKMDRFLTVLIIGTLFTFIGLFFVANNILKGYNKREFYEFGSDKIPSIYTVLGRKDIVTFQESSQLYIAKYSVASFSNDDLENYVSALYEQDFKSIHMVDDAISLIRPANQENQVIIVNIYLNASNLVFEYLIKNGNINDFELDETKKIGAQNIGFIEVPFSYMRELETNDIIEYLDPIEQEYMIIEKPTSDFNIQEYILEYKSNGYKSEEFKIKGNNAYALNKGYHYIIIVDTKENGIIRFEKTTKDVIDLFRIINTYSFDIK